MLIRNFSRHDLNADQFDLLKKIFGDDVEVSPPLKPFFRSAKHLARSINGATSCLVAPSSLLLEAMAESLLDEATIIAWVADEDARERGRFACRGMNVFWISLTGGVVWDASQTCSPTVEQNLRTGEVFPYGDPTVGE